MITADQLTLIEAALEAVEKALPNGLGKGIIQSMRITFEEECKQADFKRCDDCEDFFKSADPEYPFCGKCLREYAEALEDDAITARDVERSK